MINKYRTKPCSCACHEKKGSLPQDDYFPNNHEIIPNLNLDSDNYSRCLHNDNKVSFPTLINCHTDYPTVSYPPDHKDSYAKKQKSRMTQEERDKLIRELQEDNKRISLELQWLRSEQVQISEDVLSLSCEEEVFNERNYRKTDNDDYLQPRKDFNNPDDNAPLNNEMIKIFQRNYNYDLSALVQRQQNLSYRMQKLINIRLELMTYLKRLNQSNYGNYATYASLHGLQAQRDKLREIPDHNIIQNPRYLTATNQFPQFNKRNSVQNFSRGIYFRGNYPQVNESGAINSSPQLDSPSQSPPPPAPPINREQTVDRRISDFYDAFPNLLPDRSMEINPNFGIQNSGHKSIANISSLPQILNMTKVKESPIMNTVRSRNVFSTMAQIKSLSLDRRSSDTKRSILRRVDDSERLADGMDYVPLTRLTKGNLKTDRKDEMHQDNPRNVVWLDQLQVDKPSCSDESGIDSLTQQQTTNNQQSNSNKTLSQNDKRTLDDSKVNTIRTSRRKLPKEPK